MSLRKIDLDEEGDCILSEAFVEECEEAYRDSLLAQKERAERGFREGRFITWDEVNRRNDL